MQNRKFLSTRSNDCYHKQNIKDKKTSTIAVQENTLVVALALYTGKKIVLTHDKSLAHKRRIFKLPQIKYDRAKHGPYDLEKLLNLLLKEYLSESYDSESYHYFVRTPVAPNIDYLILYKDISNHTGSINGNMDFWSQIDFVGKSFKYIFVKKKGMVMILPSVDEAIRGIPNK